MVTADPTWQIGGVSAPSDHLRIHPGVRIPISELTWRFAASGGPGGQHANTSNTRAEVVFDIASSPSLSEAHRERLRRRFGDQLAVAASDERSQSRNRALALERMEQRLGDALAVPRRRLPTRKTKASQRRRLDAKAQRSSVKRQRRRPTLD